MKKFNINGRSRSGTTITHRILNSHPDIQCLNANNLQFKDEYYDGKSKWFGFKSGTPLLENVNVSFKYIHIVRDGRDSVSSGIRRTKSLGYHKSPWRSPDPTINSEDWAEHYFRWERIKAEILPPGSWLDIRFEDYIDVPGKNAVIMANFLDVDERSMVKAENKLISLKESHKGYHVEWVPGWKKTFHPDAIKALELLGYI